MTTRANNKGLRDLRPDCRVRLEELFDARFGAPGVFAIVACTHCGLEQTWPRPGAGELKELHEG